MYMYIHIREWGVSSLASRRGQDKQDFHRRATNPIRVAIIICVLKCAQFAANTTHVAMCCFKCARAATNAIRISPSRHTSP